MALQAFILLLDVGVWSGFKRKIEIAESFLLPLVTVCCSLAGQCSRDANATVSR